MLRKVFSRFVLQACKFSCSCRSYHPLLMKLLVLLDEQFNWQLEVTALWVWKNNISSFVSFQAVQDGIFFLKGNYSSVEMKTFNIHIPFVPRKWQHLETWVCKTVSCVRTEMMLLSSSTFYWLSTSILSICMMIYSFENI